MSEADIGTFVGRGISRRLRSRNLFFVRCRHAVAVVDLKLKPVRIFAGHRTFGELNPLIINDVAQRFSRRRVVF